MRVQQGLKKLEFSLKGRNTNLISIDAFVFFNSGKINKRNHCWQKGEDQTWKMHSSCIEIFFEKEELSESERQELLEFEKLMQGR